MADMLRCYITILLAVSVSHASVTSKCPDLLLAPSDSSPALLVGTVQDKLVADKDGKYGVVLLLQHVTIGEDVMEEYLSSQDHPQR